MYLQCPDSFVSPTGAKNQFWLRWVLEFVRIYCLQTTNEGRRRIQTGSNKNWINVDNFKLEKITHYQSLQWSIIYNDANGRACTYTYVMLSKRRRHLLSKTKIYEFKNTADLRVSSTSSISGNIIHIITHDSYGFPINYIFSHVSISLFVIN